MKCEEWLPLIEEYLDGELDRSQARKVAAHIASCPTCHSAYDGLKREQGIYSNYQRDVDVSPALWVGVSSRIRAEKAARPNGRINRFYQWFQLASGAPKLSPAWAAALVILAVAATIVTMKYLNRPGASQQLAERAAPSPSVQSSTPSLEPTPGPSVPGTVGQKDQVPAELPKNLIAGGTHLPSKAARPVRPVTLSPEQVVKEAEQKQIAAIAMLSREIDRRRSDLDPALVAKFQVALTAVDRTIAQTRQAVHDHPGDPVAAQYMLAAYAEKMEVLKEMASQ